MLHIKDIEAFARINEALSDEADIASTEDTGTAGTAAHPALLLAMVATGRLPLSALPKAAPGASPSPPWNRPVRKP
ncbi:hypothetical protein [Azospirillum doebereinerae]|uniref:Uncharacterized protein n=1 Tax=Azospirillum doebereinerae TaxID=92933 RepID=A0A3S0XJK7_9PROT|nr:hypothetical protein [Azospirillum doebereinerae]MCG5243048.1 hypothetical protein [Azospirillum doebereinerae]RUQ65898.1 hypothetical protein EJ913_24815 [Azospirillum doebereinerae]